MSKKENQEHSTKENLTKKTEEKKQSVDNQELSSDSVKDNSNNNKQDKSLEFDWDSGLVDDYSKDERKKLEDLYVSTIPSDSDKGETIEGDIVSITEKEVIVNIGYKSDGIISKSEFKDKNELKIGDKIDVLIFEKEDSTGQLNLSYTKARTLKAWRLVNEAYDDETVVQGKITHRTKGGMIVKVFGVIDLEKQ